ncbi:pyridoxal kinase [Rhizoclosmatium globosum]|uniref:pyridoxal kinase n=1 Tax=Rhizoclosmatium globosum TaxID=329046 RepID=A0A1Y2BYX5_9FUNG|nr:pyridoxal kinase [Rhizoclosmatium globosum]|eukprot:ORY39969.1 pyridoxal kinase [Rhizoclosmatium globosum]
MTTKRVLSIQSHVVHGHVGNKSATFPLNLLGFNVDPLNTVQFSNHTGYGVFTGDRLDGNQVLSLFDGLTRNGITDQYSHLLTGYLGKASILEAVIQIAKALKALPKPPLFVLDPVLGDNNSLYVPQELVPLYRDSLCPLADVITPNGFEAELLSGLPIKSEAEAIAALDKLHSLGPKTVVITSVDWGAGSQTWSMFVSHSSTNSDSVTRFKIDFPRLVGSFTGTGDLFAALLLARIIDEEAGNVITPKSLIRACELAVATMHHVLLETVERMNGQSQGLGSDAERGGKNVKYRELSVIDSRKWIENPTLEFKAVMI